MSTPLERGRLPPGRSHGDERLLCCGKSPLITAATALTPRARAGGGAAATLSGSTARAGLFVITWLLGFGAHLGRTFSGQAIRCFPGLAG